MCTMYVFRHLLGAYLKIESMSHCYVHVQIQSVLLDFSKMGHCIMFSVVVYPCFICLPSPCSFKPLNFVHQCVLHFNFNLFGDLGRLAPLNLLMCSGVIQILFHVKCLFKYFAQFKLGYLSFH